MAQQVGYPSGIQDGHWLVRWKEAPPGHERKMKGLPDEIRQIGEIRVRM
jgi:hypothetical protein